MSSIWAWAAARSSVGDDIGGVDGRVLLPGKVRDRSVPQFGQQGTALRRGGGRTGTVIVMVVDDMFRDGGRGRAWQCVLGVVCLVGLRAGQENSCSFSDSHNVSVRPPSFGLALSLMSGGGWLERKIRFVASNASESSSSG